jgi:DNA-binding PucR family transcriptional regulator
VTTLGALFRYVHSRIGSLGGGLDAVVHGDEPHLAETVIAYARGGFSLSAPAKGLHLTANSVAYRLERWRSLTGWSPTQFDGLIASWAAIELADAGRTSPHGTIVDASPGGRRGDGAAGAAERSPLRKA